METHGWDAVAEATLTAKAIAFDGCHKIYLAMDEGQVERFRDLGYGEGLSNLVTIDDQTPDSLFRILERWYEVSCGLKFIDAVVTNEVNPNAGFTGLIPQGWESDEWIDITEEEA
jgi:hypothetical protein